MVCSDRKVPNVRVGFLTIRNDGESMNAIIEINKTLEHINNHISQAERAQDLGDAEGKLAHARAAFLLIGDIRAIIDSAEEAVDLDLFFEAVGAYRNATRALLELLLA